MSSLNQKAFVVSGNIIRPTEHENKDENSEDGQAHTGASKMNGKELFEQVLQQIEEQIKERDRESLVKHLKTRFDNCKEVYKNSKEFVRTMKSTLKKLSHNSDRKSDVYPVIEEITMLLQSYRKSNNKMHNTSGSGSPAENNDSNNLDDAAMAAGPSTSGGVGDSSAKKRHHSGSSKESSNSKKSRGSSRQIQHLEDFMFKMDKEIKKLSSRELTLEDMDREDSDHIKEHKLKKKLLKFYQVACNLKGRSTECGRAIEKKIKFEGTRYPEINKKVEKLVNGSGVFPDFQDIKSVVQKVNNKKGLNLTSKQVHSLSQDSFTVVGNKLIQRRKKDYTLNTGSYLTDAMNMSDDPAKHDKELERKLKENRRTSKSRINELLDHYTRQQYDFEAKLEKEDDEQVRKQLMGDDDDEEEEEEEEEEGETDSILFGLDTELVTIEKSDDTSELYNPGLSVENSNEIGGASSGVKMNPVLSVEKSDEIEGASSAVKMKPKWDKSKIGFAFRQQPASNSRTNNPGLSVEKSDEFEGARSGVKKKPKIGFAFRQQPASNSRTNNMGPKFTMSKKPTIPSLAASPAAAATNSPANRASPPFVINKLSRTSRTLAVRKILDDVTTAISHRPKGLPQVNNDKTDGQLSDNSSDDVICLSD